MIKKIPFSVFIFGQKVAQPSDLYALSQLYAVSEKLQKLPIVCQSAAGIGIFLEKISKHDKNDEDIVQITFVL